MYSTILKITSKFKDACFRHVIKYNFIWKTVALISTKNEIIYNKVRPTPRDLCREKSSFQYGGDEPSRLDFGADQDTTSTSVSEWVNTRALEIVLLPVSGGPVSFLQVLLSYVLCLCLMFFLLSCQSFRWVRSYLTLMCTVHFSTLPISTCKYLHFLLDSFYIASIFTPSLRLLANIPSLSGNFVNYQVYRVGCSYWYK